MENEAYIAKPHFYSDGKGGVFGAFALTEDTETLLPFHPAYAVDGTPVTDYRLCLISTTQDKMLGETDYFAAVEKLRAYAEKSDEREMVVRGLTLDELLKIL